MKFLAKNNCAPEVPVVVVVRARGFGLIELMIVVAVVAILSAVGYPSYVGYVQRANRVAAKAALDEVAQYMERQFTINNAYPASPLPAIYATAPFRVQSGQQKYNMTLTTAGTPPSSYVVTATPINANVDPTCDVMRLDNVGNQRAVGHLVTAAAVEVDLTCWQK